MEGGREEERMKIPTKRMPLEVFTSAPSPAGLVEDPEEAFTSLSELEVAFPGEQPLNKNS